MQHALNLVLAVLLGLFNLIVATIAIIEGVVRRGLATLGIHGGSQTAILVVVVVLLIIAAIRLFGRLFAILIAVFLLLLLLHALIGGSVLPAGANI